MSPGETDQKRGRDSHPTKILLSGKELFNVSMLQHRIHDLKLFVKYIVMLKVLKLLILSINRG